MTRLSARRSALLAAPVIALAAAPTAHAANEGFVAVTPDNRVATYTEQTAGSFTSQLKPLRGERGARIAALDRAPGAGPLFALDVAGRVFTLDARTGRLTARLGGRPVAGAVAIGAPLTFAVEPGGGAALVESRGVARRVDLRTGAATPVTATGLVLDTRADGGRFGFDALTRAVVRVDGDAATTVGRLPFAPVGATRFTLAADGPRGWALTRTNGTMPHPGADSRWSEIAVATGAATRPVFLRAFDALAATGSAPRITRPAKVEVRIPRSVSRVDLRADSGLTVRLRSDQSMNPTGSMLTRPGGRLLGIGLTFQPEPERWTSLDLRANTITKPTLLRAGRIRVHLTVRGYPGTPSQTFDRWVGVTG